MPERKNTLVHILKTSSNEWYIAVPKRFIIGTFSANDSRLQLSAGQLYASRDMREFQRFTGGRYKTIRRYLTRSQVARLEKVAAEYSEAREALTDTARDYAAKLGRF